MKFLAILALFGIFHGTNSIPLAKTVDDSLDNYIKAVLETFKASMPTGIPELGIPVLDPFDVPKFEIPHIE